MKAGYTTDRRSIEQGDNCIVVDNHHTINEYTEWSLEIDNVSRFANEYTVGVWIPKGTKRPDNWPNKK